MRNIERAAGRSRKNQTMILPFTPKVQSLLRLAALVFNESYRRRARQWNRANSLDRESTRELPSRRSLRKSIR